MSEYKPLDGTADVLPVGLQPTPFGEVWQALQQVAASVWNVDPSVYRAGMAWLWYAVNHPDDLASDSLRALLVAALISEQAPMVKDWQTNAELAEYLRVWRTYSPTYAKLEAIFATFGARVEVRPISDAESQGVVPVADRRFAFYLRVEEFDAARPLTLDEVYQIAVRATPLGARPVPYFALVGSSDVFAGPASAGLVRALWASEPAEPVTPPTPPAYTEITLYYSNNYKGYQTNVTSAFTGNVNANYCYQLFTDEQCTTPWAGYDYSNDYEVGWYNDGVWEPLISKIEDMPSTTSGARKNGFILMDTGCMWLCTNVSSSSAYNTGTQAFIRVYPSGIQRLALYTNSSSVYNNKTIAYQSYTELYSKPGASGYIYAGNWPSKRPLKVLASSGAVVSTGYNDFNFSTYSNRLVLANVFGDSVSKNARCVVFTLSEIVYYAWTKSDKSDLIVSSNAVKKPLYDSDGNLLLGDSGYTYHCIGIFNAQGSSTGDTAAKINAFIMSVNSNSGALQYKQESGSSITVAKLWYYKKLKPIEVNFGDPVTIPAGYHVKSVTCSRGYAFASNVSSESSIMGQFVHYELSGEKVYFDKTNTALVGVGVAPALQIFALADLNNSGYYVSTKSGTSASYLTSASASYLNSDGYFVKGSTTYSDSNVMNSVAYAMQTFPVYFNLADSAGNWLYFCFNVPQTLWQFSGGVFSWRGNTASFLDLAYWYNGRAVQINLRPIT